MAGKGRRRSRCGPVAIEEKVRALFGGGGVLTAPPLRVFRKRKAVDACVHGKGDMKAQTPQNIWTKGRRRRGSFVAVP
jgi:hypothetical protein